MAGKRYDNYSQDTWERDHPPDDDTRHFPNQPRHVPTGWIGLCRGRNGHMVEHVEMTISHLDSSVKRTQDQKVADDCNDVRGQRAGNRHIPLAKRVE